MKTVKTIGAAAALFALAGVANAAAVEGDYSTYARMAVSSAVQMENYAGPRAGEIGTLYSNMGSGTGYVAFTGATGPIGFDDYDTGFTGMQTLDTFSFVGGVAAAGEVLFFEFYDSASNFVDAFSIAFGGGGNFIYTISGGGGAPIGTAFDSAGIVQVIADAGSTGQWFLADAGPTVGTEDAFFGGNFDGIYSHNFELNGIPAPGALALLSLGGLVATRRRR